jgi:hypothetical protein
VLTSQLGPGAPSILWVNSMADIFVPDRKRPVEPIRPMEAINRIFETVAISPHIGLVLTKYPNVMVKYFPVDGLAMPATISRVLTMRRPVPSWSRVCDFQPSGGPVASTLRFASTSNKHLVSIGAVRWLANARA